MPFFVRLFVRFFCFPRFLSHHVIVLSQLIDEGIDNVRLDLDPTLLLCGNEWSKLANRSKLKWTRKFILFYSLEKSDDVCEAARKMQEYTGMMIGVYGLSYSPEINITNFWLGFAGTLMCAFGWGIEAVIIAKSVQDDAVTDEIALQIRQTTSALVYGVVILPIMKGWGFTLSLFSGTGWLIPTIAIAALFATISYLFYYKAISQIGASKSMALNITYSAWAVVISIVFLGDYSLLNPVTIICTFAVLVFGILAGADYKDLIKKD